MGFFERTNPTSEMIPKLMELAGLTYQEIHGEEDVDVVLDPEEETIIVNGKYSECFTFSQFI